LLLAAAMCWPAEGAIRKRKVRTRRAPDTLVVPFVPPEMPVSRKMNTSTYPVQISVTGRVVQIQSDHNQLLPIYNAGGVLYMTARLTKGKNWLGGLPRGQYFINNRPITIN
jgi:hypothetical protein